jgi:signal transduction histidine kinase
MAPATTPDTAPAAADAALAFERLLADVVAHLAAAPGARRAAHPVEGLLEPVARFFGAEQAFVTRRQADGSDWARSHVWSELGMSLAEGRSTDASRWTDDELLAGRDVLANDLAALPEAAAPERERLRAARVRSLLYVPLRGPGGTVGCAGLRTTSRAAAWDAGDARRLRLVGEVILGLLAAQGAETTPDSTGAAEALQRLEERLYVALETARIGVFDWDVASDRVWYISPFVQTQPFRRDTHETNTSQWFQTTHPDDMAASREEVARAVRGSAPSFTTLVRMKMPHYKGDEWVFVRSRGRVLERDAEGRARRVIGVYEDVSDEVRRQVLEREREAALEHARRASSLGTLATSLAHELNQPLAALANFVEGAARLLAQGDARRDEVQAALQRSAALAQKASEIVRRMRRLVQHAPPQLEPVDLAAVMREVVEHLGRDARVAGIEVRALPRHAAGPIPGDRIQLEQVLLNLVRNAIEAVVLRAHGPRAVRVESRDAGGRVEVRVIDTGPGVPAHVAERLFEPFTTTKTSGSGLGLTISRSIVEAHGGAIRLERTGADGACFLVSLPAGGPLDDAR